MQISLNSSAGTKNLYRRFKRRAAALTLGHHLVEVSAQTTKSLVQISVLIIVSCWVDFAKNCIIAPRFKFGLLAILFYNFD